jgi:hypothetical protein
VENMSTITSPPKNDEVIERHQFYSSIAKDVNSCNRANAAIGEKLDTLAINYNLIRDITKASETRNKTLISAAVVVWAIIGGSVGVYVQRSVAASDKLMSRLEATEKRLASIDTMVENNKDLPAAVDTQRRGLADVRRQLDDMEVKRK